MFVEELVDNSPFIKTYDLMCKYKLFYDNYK